MPKADKQATDARKFVEPKSHVTKDGREVLHKLDWQRRVKELRERCGGRCEYRLLGTALMEGGEDMRCCNAAADPHHIKLRSRSRDDRMTNLLAVCRHHHRILDAEQRKERVKR
jgi:hypothetical protein